MLILQHWPTRTVTRIYLDIKSKLYNLDKYNLDEDVWNYLTDFRR